ncbi:MAG: hypothetical protein AB8C84_04495 [Oligoflexales bacterium]
MHKTFMFITAAGLAGTAVGAYMFSMCEDTSFDINNFATFDAQKCEDSLGSQLKDFGLIGTAMAVLNWCGKKTGRHRSYSRTTDHDLNRACIMASRF